MKDKRFSTDANREPLGKDEDDQEVGQIGESVEEIMNKMNVEPPEDFAERSFQYTLEGIREARKKVRRKRRMNRWVQFSGSLGLVAVVALLVFQLVSPQEWRGDQGNLGPSPGEEQKPSEEGEPSEPGEPPESDKEDAEELPESDSEDPAENSNTAVREPTKEITVYPEGMEETRTFQLLDEPSVPFTTYIPQDYEAIPLNGVKESEGMSGVRITPQNNDFVNMDILFFPQGTTEEEATQAFEEMVFNLDQDTGTGVSRDEPWMLQVYSSFPPGERSGRNLYLGYAANYYFYVHIEINNLEVQDGWAPTVDTIYEEWRWNETGERLE